MPSNQEFYDAINNISVDADTLNLNTDQLESKLDTTTGLLTTLSADTAIIKADMANGVLVNGTVTANTGLTPLTDTQLRATAVPVSGTVTANLNDPTFAVIVGQIEDALFGSDQLINALNGGLSLTNNVPVSGTVNTSAVQGTTVSNTNFTSTTSDTLVSAVSTRKVLTVHNEGPATLFINAGSSVSTTSYQVRLLAGDYWEAPAGQQSLQHSGIFSSAGSAARVTQIS
jgi:hypothetical protein